MDRDASDSSINGAPTLNFFGRMNALTATGDFDVRESDNYQHLKPSGRKLHNETISEEANEERPKAIQANKNKPKMKRCLSNDFTNGNAKSLEECFEMISPIKYDVPIDGNFSTTDDESNYEKDNGNDTFVTQKRTSSKPENSKNKRPFSFQIKLVPRRHKDINDIVSQRSTKRSSCPSSALQAHSLYSSGLPPLKKNKKKQKIDLTLFDYPLPKEMEKISCNVPSMIFTELKFGSESVVYRALCFENMSDYPKPVVDKVVEELKNILKKLISKNMITETQYLDNVLKSIKSEITESNKKQDEVDFDARIELAEGEIEIRRQYWQKKRMELEETSHCQLEVLDGKYFEAKKNLEAEWSSPEMQMRYGKPSHQLLEANFLAKSHLQARDFDGAVFYSNRIARLESTEVESAMIKMQKDYNAAAHNLSKKFNSDVQVARETANSRMCNLLAAEDADLRPYIARLEYLKQRKIEEANKKLRIQRAEVKANVKVMKYKVYDTKEAQMERLCPK